MKMSRFTYFYDNRKNSVQNVVISNRIQRCKSVDKPYLTPDRKS